MPTNDLRVSILSHDIAEGDIKANLESVGGRIAASAPSADLIVLPELFTTNFIDNRDSLISLAEPADASPTLATTGEWAAEHDVAIAGSILVSDRDGKMYNRAFVALPDRRRLTYDKHHLFILGGESRHLTPGGSPGGTIDYRGWRLKLAVCYDVRFPAWVRNRDLEWDCLIVPASWPASRAYAWRQLLSARAIENQGYVIGANRTGTDSFGDYLDENIEIYDHWGKPAGLHNPADGTVSATLSAAEIEKCRRRFPVWRDADSFELTGR